MKLFLNIYSTAILFLVLFTATTTSHADREDSIKTLFNWAENNHSDLFLPSSTTIQKQEPWTFVHYTETDTYIGVNNADEVWVLGDVFNGLLYIDTLINLLGIIGSNSDGVDSALTQQAYIKASNADSLDWFGHSIAISGDTLVVGAINEAGVDIGINANQLDNSKEMAGAVYVFVREPGGLWQQQAYIKPPIAHEETAVFGYSVAISNDTLVISEPGITSVYVYVRDEEGLWHMQEHITSPFRTKDVLIKDSLFFGWAVAIDGDTIVVGSPYDGYDKSDLTGDNFFPAEENMFSGAVHIYKRETVADSILWINQAYIKASNIGAEDKFGTSVAISGDTIIVGAPKEDSANGDQLDNSAPDAGAAYIFTRDKDEVWSQKAYLKASNGDVRDDFGFSVAISGDTAAVGAPLEDSSAVGINGDQLSNFSTDSGAAYVYVRNESGVWTQQAYLKASNTGARYKFGSSIALFNDTLVVGSPEEGKRGTGINSAQELDRGTDLSPASGSAYLYSREGTNWSKDAYIKASNTMFTAQFGSSLSLSNGVLAVGAKTESFAEGAAYIFE